MQIKYAIDNYAGADILGVPKNADSRDVSPAIFSAMPTDDCYICICCVLYRYWYIFVYAANNTVKTIRLTCHESGYRNHE